MSDIAKAAVNATSGGIVNSVDVKGAANVATTVSFTAASGAASTFENLLQKTPASVFPLDTYGNVTVTGVQLVTGEQQCGRGFKATLLHYLVINAECACREWSWYVESINGYLWAGFSSAEYGLKLMLRLLSLSVTT